MSEEPGNGRRSNRTIRQLIGDGARVLPEKSHGWFRNWFRKVWKVPIERWMFPDEDETEKGPDTV